MTDLHLIISDGGTVLGKTFSSTNASRHKIVSRDPVHVVSGPKDLEGLPKSTLVAMSEDIGVTSDNAQHIWRKLRKRRRVPYWGKVSVKQVIRTLFTDEPYACYTKDALLDIIPGASWISIATAFSMLKNKKYAGGELIFIERDEDGNYVRVDSE